MVALACSTPSARRGPGAVRVIAACKQVTIEDAATEAVAPLRRSQRLAWVLRLRGDMSADDLGFDQRWQGSEPPHGTHRTTRSGPIGAPFQAACRSGDVARPAVIRTPGIGLRTASGRQRGVRANDHWQGRSGSWGTRADRGERQSRMYRQRRSRPLAADVGGGTGHPSLPAQRTDAAASSDSRRRQCVVGADATSIIVDGGGGREAVARQHGCMVAPSPSPAPAASAPYFEAM
jgi:hypothetical protein